MGTEVFALADMLLIANHMAALLEPGQHQPFAVRVVSTRPGAVRLAGALTLQAAGLPRRLGLLVVPGLEASRLGGWDKRLAPLGEEIAAIRRHHRRGLPLASVCIGSFLLAQAGVLDGRRAATAWPFAGDFATRFPQVKLDRRAVIAEDAAVITTGAVSSAFDLAVLLIERHMGRKVARASARIALVGGPRATQQPFVDPALAASAAPPFAARVNARLAAQLAAPYDLGTLAAALHVSSRTLLRRYRAETGSSPLAWLKQARVEKAKALLEKSRLSVSQVVDAVGYQDVPTFSRLFGRLVGESPAQYRRRVAPGTRR